MALMPKDIVDAVREVLINANRGKGTDPSFLTAYQILNRLSEPTRRQLMQERTGAGKGTGVYYGAASVVSDAAEMLAKQRLAQISYFDCGGIEIRLADQDIVPGNGICGLYRAIS